MSLLTAPVELRPLSPARDDRWQPSRAGIVNLWRYWDETFTFHEGRLLLRGPNGSGKSMALELLLPFLLDGDASPAKLTSAARSRGGLYERVMTGTSDSARTGFAWIELRRGDDRFTIGARIRASSSTRSATRTLFTTTQTVGADLHLLDEGRVPISRKALDEAVGHFGRVTDSAAEHREAVRAALFDNFNADRYDALVNALLALRKEKLSQHLDLEKLNQVMSEALPAVDDHEIATVAEGFERLDRRRDELTLLERDVGAVDSLAQRQRAYARAVIAASANEVRQAESARTGIVRRQREAAEQLAAVVAEIGELEAEEQVGNERLLAIGGETDGIKASELYKEGHQLAELQRSLDQQVSERDRLAADLADRRSDEEEAAKAVGTAERAVADAGQNEQAARRELAATAEPAGAGAVLERAMADGHDDGLALIGGWVRERRNGIAEIDRLLDAHRRAVDRRQDEEERLDQQRQRVDELTTERRQAAGILVDEQRAFVAAAHQWADQSVSFDDPWRLLITSNLDDAAVAADHIDNTVHTIRSEQAQRVAVAKAGLDQRRSEVRAERADLQAELTELAAGRMPQVVAPPWRSPRPDDGPDGEQAPGRAGAPFWQLVDVVDGTSDEVVDRIESALVAAGLADAWVSPSGTFDLPDDLADLVLTAVDDDPDRAGTLADLLRPAPDTATSCGVAHETVARVLASITVASGSAVPATADDTVVIGTDGTFRIGSATGRGAAAAGVLLGAAARERHRLAEIERLTGLVDECDRRLRRLDAEEAQLATDDEAVQADLAARPSRQASDEAARELASAEVRLGEADASRRAAEAAVAKAEEAVRAAQRDLATRASTLGLPADHDQLRQLAGAVDAVEQSARVWHNRAGELATATKQLDQANAGLERARRATSGVEQRWQWAHESAATLGAKVKAISSAIGQDFEELVARLAALEQEQRDLTARQKRLASRGRELYGREGRLKEAESEASRQLADAEVHREAVHDSFTELFASPLPSDADVQAAAPVLDGVTAVLGHARTVAAELDSIQSDPKRLEHLSTQVQARLHDTQATVGVRIDLDRHQTDGGWYVLRGSTGGVRHGLAELRSHLRHQLTEARAELHAQEAELFERTLAGSIRHALADRIRGANSLVAQINAQLAGVQTAAGGVAVKLRWDVDDDQPEAMRTARALLLRDPADLTASEREALQEFVRARVDQARAELEHHAPWEARLRESLDYRAWHRFSLQLAHRDWDGYRPATPRLLQRLSTGERSVALHLPMLASIAAHYTGPDGEPGTGPRLILLDELFAGVDAANRAQLFGTFTSWDLDAVFTSDHEWCQYASLDGIAIHHLQGGSDDEPVTSTRFTWDGHERRLDEIDHSAA